MERLNSWESYKTILKETRKRGLNKFSNNYLDMNSVKRYITLKRIEYELKEECLYLYIDEGDYYRLYVQCGAALAESPKRDKPVLMRNIYREHNKAAFMQEIELQLRDVGFEMYDESVQIVANPLEDREEIYKRLEKAEKFLGRFGLRIVYADDFMLEDIYRLRDDIPELKPYHFFYETMEEKKQAVDNGYFRCVVNEQNELCAAQQFKIEENGIQGNWLAVAKAYQEKYGIGAAMAYHSFVYAIDHNINNYFGWVVRNNERSIKYHQSIGYKVTDKVADEWILL